MNLARILSLATRVGTIFGSDWPRNLPKGDSGLYVLCRELAAKLEAANPGLAEELGYARTTKTELKERITPL